jgi:NitT/TauT family transport system substrate-binding protein
MNRRAFLAAAAGGVATIAAGATLARRSSAGGGLRIGVMSNLTHAPLLAGLGSGRIARALAPTPVEMLLFRAGPRVSEALIGEAIDVGTAGPAALVVHHARHGKALRILSGCCSGGASFVVGRTSGIQRPADLRGKRLAVTQIGTTQDIALRVYLHEAGLRDTTSGGDVTVLAISGATILDQMKRGELHGAWLPEPWATRIVVELSATRLVDERDLWPNRRFSTAALATRASKADDPAIRRLVVALEDEVSRAVTDPATTLREAHTELKRRIGNPGSFSIFEKSAKVVDYTSDPLRESVERFGEAAASFGLCPPHPADGLFPAT